MKRGYINLKDVKTIQKDVGFFKCPKCSHLSISLMGYECKCGHKWTEEETKNKDNVTRMNSEVLVCPECKTEIEKTNDNLTYQGYACYECNSVLEYIDYPSHGTTDDSLKLVKTTDYFHARHHDCKGMMVMGNKLVIRKENNMSILLIPLECKECGYRDLIKIPTILGKGDVAIIREGEEW